MDHSFLPLRRDQLGPRKVSVQPMPVRLLISNCLVFNEFEGAESLGR